MNQTVIEQDLDAPIYTNMQVPDGPAIFTILQRGISHRGAGTVCQDYCLMERVSDKLQVTAVADGHGGATYIYSDVGSRLACETLCQLVKEYYLKSLTSNLSEDEAAERFTSLEFRKELIERWREAVMADYQEKLKAAGADGAEKEQQTENNIRKYGTTLLFTIVMQNWLIVGQNGDGAALLFNDNEQNQYYQFHRRPGVKIGSITPGSMCSGRAVYSTMVRAYRKECFTHVLLSTDGIYDKLSIGSSFYIYGKQLAQKVRTNTFAENTFVIDSGGEQLDLHKLSKDDCSLSLVCLQTDGLMQDPSAFLEEKGYEKITLVKSIGNLRVYRGVLDGLPVDIHAVRRETAKLDAVPDLPAGVHILSSIDSFKDEQGVCYDIYPTFESVYEVSELIEACQHLEADESVPIFFGSDAPNPFNNAFWLKLLQLMMELHRKLNAAGIDFSEMQYEVMHVAENGSLLLYDLFEPVGGKREAAAWKTFRGYFSIIGKLVYQDTELPLFSTRYIGQMIRDPASGMDKPFGRVLLQKEKNLFWLRNYSDRNWIIGHDKTKVVEPNHMVRIAKSRTITAENADGEDEYSIVIFTEKEE